MNVAVVLNLASDQKSQKLRRQSLDDDASSESSTGEEACKPETDSSTSAQVVAEANGETNASQVPCSVEAPKVRPDGRTVETEVKVGS